MNKFNVGDIVQLDEMYLKEDDNKGGAKLFIDITSGYKTHHDYHSFTDEHDILSLRDYTGCSVSSGSLYMKENQLTVEYIDNEFKNHYICSYETDRDERGIRYIWLSFPEHVLNRYINYEFKTPYLIEKLQTALKLLDGI